ncbi:hypothetical protein QJ856_gp0865 [Tupanvirus deep ocean]|uniref:Uncharacterized protein n=2 Tax=Tupanvirus TaxID=2094720 RepID=A0AC62A7Y2_9VIRU|nr:hypothetical protein QJ856_gp0865 [Tupanvirus deep ocean]QKU33890.1 hypothetical protein [Tupanvirus deep ocean]
MEKFKTLYEICLDERNINDLLEVIRSDIKLSERSIPKCALMMQDIMKKNINKLTRPPRNKDEFKILVRYLNKLCVSTIIDIIAKKYPDLQISRKVQVSKEQMRRDRDVWGDRQNHVQDRPYTRSRREYDDDETFYNMRPNDIGVSGTDNDNGGYASAFGNHLITNLPLGQKQPQVFNQGSQRGESQFEQRFQQLVNERNYGIGQQQKPETPDFTLDGTGEQVKQQKMMRKMQEQMNGMGGGMMGMQNGMNGMMGNGMPMGMGGMSMDDPYASILGAGAPQQSMGQQQQMNPFMGMGNPLMPMSSTNMMADQLGFNSMNNFQNGFGMNQPVSAKSMQLSNDYERKLAERRMVDLETNQPQTSNQNYGNQMAMMGGMQMPGMMGSSPQIPNMMGSSAQMPGMMGSSPQIPNMMGSSPQMPGMMASSPQIPNMMGGMQMPNMMGSMQMPGMMPNM